jgi:hypothetical protein
MFSPRWQPFSYAGGIIRSIRNFVSANGEKFGLDAAEQGAWWSEQESSIAADAFFFSVNRYAFLATR